MIKIQDLSFRYPGCQQMILDHMHLEIADGEWIVLQGASGCGKTTLALAIAGFLYHSTEGIYQGNIEINGKNIEDLAISEVASQVYLVQQNPENQFCTLTVQDELAFGLENRNVDPLEIKRRIQQALEIVHGENLAHANLLELSGGEKQKIAIATAIAMKPEIIILDEPTSNLDPVSSNEVFRALYQLKEVDGITVIIIEHKIRAMLDFKPRLLQMNAGKIVEDNQTVVPSPIMKKVRNGKIEKVCWEPVLEVENFSVSRGDEEIVKIKELVIYPGEFITLMGANGSGKSTLLLGLLGLLDRKADKGRFLGENLMDLKPGEMARECGYVFQNPDHQLFCDSVEQEMVLAPANFGLSSAAIKPGMIFMLKEFDLVEKMQEHPFNLSFGQKKRLNLASVLTYQPKLLLLDEIFIGQDEENLRISLKILEDYMNRQQAAVILVNHYIEPLQNQADRIIFLDKGEVLFDVPMRKYAEAFRKFGKEEYLPDY